jgi:hypothetical protein
LASFLLLNYINTNPLKIKLLTKSLKLAFVPKPSLTKEQNEEMRVFLTLSRDPKGDFSTPQIQFGTL